MQLLGEIETNKKQKSNENETNNLNENGAALFVGDCYSPVTEEETSLAQDEVT